VRHATGYLIVEPSVEFTFAGICNVPNTSVVRVRGLDKSEQEHE
jgi:hypothetical protein